MRVWLLCPPAAESPQLRRAGLGEGCASLLPTAELSLCVRLSSVELCWQSSSFSTCQSTFMQNLPGQLRWFKLIQPCCCCLKQIRRCLYHFSSQKELAVRVQQTFQQAWRDPEIITLQLQPLTCQIETPSGMALLHLSSHLYNITAPYLQ